MDKQFFRETFGKDNLRKIVCKVLDEIPVFSYVAVGSAEMKEDGALDTPVIVARCDGEDTIPMTHREMLEGYIKGAAEDIVASEEICYDVKENPVFAFGIESENDYYGVIFVAIDAKLSANIYFGKKATVALIEAIDDVISSILPTDAEDYLDLPIISWRYGVLANQRIFISEQDID